MALPQLVRAGGHRIEGVEAFVIPAIQAVFCAARQVRDVYVNIMALADPVEPANTLFEQLRVARQIE